MNQPLTLRGRPPLAPLARAAAVLASERTLPPRRPNATAAGFLRDIGILANVERADAAQGASVEATIEHPRTGKTANERMPLGGNLVHRQNVDSFGGLPGLGQCAGQRLGHLLRGAFERGGLCRQHGTIKPYRLGFVKW